MMVDRRSTQSSN